MRRTRNHRPTRKRKTRCYGHKGKKCKTKKNKMHARVSRSIEGCQESIEKKPTLMDREAIKHLSRRQKLSRSIYLTIERCLGVHSKAGSMDRGAIEETGDFLIDPPSYREVLKLLKNSFSRREKHRYECNQACNSTKDLNNILTSQNHLSTRKMLST